MRSKPMSAVIGGLLISFIALPALVFAQSASSVPRTPWGDPDLQGDWTSQNELGVPFERSEGVRHAPGVE